MEKLTIKDIPLEGKRILLRVDFNVPIKDGKILDDTRIQASLPTIQYLLDKGASIVIMSHMGRPKGSIAPSLSLAPCAKRLSELLGNDSKHPVQMASDSRGKEVKRQVDNLQPGEILLLENLRFHKAEEKPEKDPSFAKDLATYGDVYVNDAFGTAHRKHTSTYSVAQLFPNAAVAGLLIEKELSFLGKRLTTPERPFFAIIGGSKISTKIGVLENLLSKVDGLFIGGGMVYTFLKAQGIPVGHSIYEQDYLESAQNILKLSKEKNVPIYLPVDIEIAENFDNQSKKKIVSINEGIEDPWQGMSIGPKTLIEWKEKLKNAKTVFWNGPVGVFEFSNFAIQTNELASFLATLPATTIVGGGDSLAAINNLKIGPKFAHLSTGGGASLEFIEYGHLPGIDVLDDKK